MFAGLDEYAALHENLVPIFASYRDPQGWLYYAWVIPYGIATLVAMAAFFPFWLRLPPATRYYLLTGGAWWIGGALGMEMVGGWLVVNSANPAAALQISTLLEEMMELYGATLLFYAGLMHLKHQGNLFYLQVGGDEAVKID